MNKWLYRAVGAVGVASGALFLGSGVAHAEPLTQGESAGGPESMHNLVADLFTPAGGQRSLELDPQQDRTEIIGGLLGSGGGPLGGLLGGNGGGPLGSLLGSQGGPLGGLPIGNLLGGSNGGGPLGGLVGGNGGPLGGIVGDGGALGGLTGGGLTGGLLGGGAASQADLNGWGTVSTDPLADSTDPAVRAVLGDAGALNQVTRPGPASTDYIDPALRGTDLDTPSQQPVMLDPAASQQFQAAAMDLTPALIADAMAQRTGQQTGLQPNQAQRIAPLGDDVLLDSDLDVIDELNATEDFGLESTTEGLPIVDTIPLVGPLLGNGGPLDQVLVVGDLAKNLPVVGDLAGGDGINLDSLNQLPIVSGLLQQGLIKGDPLDQTGLPLVGNLPLVGGALNSMTGQLTSQLTTSLPGVTGEEPAAATATDPAMVTPAHATDDPLHGLAGHGTHQAVTGHQHGASQTPATGAAATGGLQQPTRQLTPVPAQSTAAERPVAGIDPEYGDSQHSATEQTHAPSLPLLGSLTGDLTGALTGAQSGGLGNQAGMGTLPVSNLINQLPLISDLPLISQLPVPLQLLRSMPVVGLVADLLPVESGTAA